MTDSAADRALAEGCAVVHLPEVPWEMSGPDRGRFLNGLVTCAVADLPSGAGRYGFVTSVKGKVLGDVTVLATEDRFLLRLPASAAGAVTEHLLKYRIADRVELEVMADTEILTVAGATAAEVLGGLVSTVPTEPWRHREATLGGVAVRIARRHPAPVPAWDLWLPADGTGAGAVRAALAEAGAADAAATDAATDTAWDALRVERGVPRFGIDFGPDNLPQETGLEEVAVSYDKGCYLGQEVVARIHYRGGVNKGLTGLDLGDAPPPAGDADPRPSVLHDGRPAGTLGTAVRSPGAGRTLALSILHRRAAEPGTAVEVDGVGPAVVRALPPARES